MAAELAQQLELAIERELTELKSITDARAGERPPRTKPDGWSRKEELGHLIDSAANNHIRFVRASIEKTFTGPGYAQDDWVRAHGYQEMPWASLIDFWQRYNLLLVRVIDRIPEEKLDTQCVVDGSIPVRLAFLIEDYILHMQHHLDHLLGREKITEYPGAKLGV